MQACEIRTGNECDGEHRLGAREHRDSTQQRRAFAGQKHEQGAGRAEDRSDLREVSMGHGEPRLRVP